MQRAFAFTRTRPHEARDDDVEAMLVRLPEMEYLLKQTRRKTATQSKSGFAFAKPCGD